MFFYLNCVLKIDKNFFIFFFIKYVESNAIEKSIIYKNHFVFPFTRKSFKKHIKQIKYSIIKRDKSIFVV